MILGLLIFLLLITLAAQYSGTQTWAAKIGANYLTERLGFPISIEKMYFSDIDKITLIGLKVIDNTDRLFIDSDTLNADLGWRAIFGGEVIQIDDLELRGTQFNMTLNPATESWNINELIRAISALSPPKDTTKVTKNIPFQITKANLYNVQFSLHNPTKDSLETGLFDYNHFTINNIYGEIDYFRLFKDTIELNVNQGSLIEPFVDFPVSNLDVFFRYTKNSLEFLNLDAQIGSSHLTDTLIFRYDSINYLSYNFIEKVDIYANLKNAEIDFADLARFAPSLKKYKERVVATGLVRGTVDDLSSKDLRIDFANQSFVDGKFAVRGLPDYENSFLDLRFKDARITVADIKQYISKSNYQTILPLGKINFLGEFLGFPSDFVANGKFETSIGNVRTDIHLNTINKTYKGKLNLAHFQAGKLAKSNFLGQITGKGKINGKGFTKEEADFELKAKVDSITLKNTFKYYSYKNILVDGRFKKPTFTGEMTIKDANLIADMRGKIDLQDSVINGRIRILKSDLQNLGLSKKIANLQGNGNFNLKGLTLNTITGTAEIRQAQIDYNKNKLALSEISLNSTFENGFRDIHLESDYVDFDIKGEFQLQDAIDDAISTFKEYQLEFLDDSASQIAYYKEKKDKFENNPFEKLPYKIDYSIDVKKINPLIRLFEPDFFIASDSKFDGVFERDLEKKQVKFTLDSYIDSLSYQDLAFYKTDLKINAIKPLDSMGVDVQTNISSEKQYYSSIVSAENMNVNAQWLGREILFDSYIKRQNENDNVSLKGSLKITDSLYSLNLINPEFLILDKKWKSDSLVKIGIQKNEIRFEDKFVLQSDNQRVEIIGKVSKDPNAILNVGLVNVDLEPFGIFLGQDIKGKANGEAFISGVYDTLKLENNLSLQKLKMAGVRIGNLHTESVWNNEEQKLNIEAHLAYRRREVVDISGYYSPKEKENPLNLDAKIIGMKLNIVEPFLNVVADNFKGYVYGAVKIKGKPEQIKLVGEAFVSGGSFRVDYLNTVYHFDDKITFTENQIGVDRLRLYDDGENIAFLDGGIFHDGFKDFVMQLRGEMNKMKVLDTKEQHNDLFYGTAFATGDFELFGALEQLGITINAKSEAGTRIYMPLSNPEDVSSTQSFIRFVNHTDSTKLDSLQSRLKKEDLSSLKMEFNLDITPDAYVEMIFDKKVGDVIRGNGQGRLKMMIDTKGDFNMYGDVEIVKGSYNFTFLNVINKEFNVDRGSHITWSGDPFAAQLDMTATYQQMASLAPIITVSDSSVLASTEIKRRYPVVVDLFLKGDLLTPDIRFDINVTEYPSLIIAGGMPISLESYVAAFKTRIQNDDQEMNKQVFSLILLRRLSTQNTFEGIDRSAGSSVSELLSNQLSNLISQVDENLEIDLNVQGLDADALNTLQLRLSYSFFEGRIRVTREGSFTNVQNQTDLASIAGDWTVEYLIFPDGKLRMKVYHKNNINTFNTALQNNSTAGASLLKIFTFDSFKDLFKFKKKKKQVPFVQDNEIRIEE
ncbi:translocation/assembly module TamB domain-containing protein [Bernardetia litoralis]|uniref:translocation/assembly module TamB domain-containing protein n=1 Tax=Bernardetia litoralis TaxID=999 RepID=UPI0012FE6301|nr:translocation/assembly module TamB domain-containing protein [Bernardetia litoralis]